MALFSFILDLILICLLSAGIYYAVGLSRQIKTLRDSRAEMERFVGAFNTTVVRAEAGVQGLKQAARSSGDDLEKLIERATSLKDELHFLVESADQIATRLSATASQTARLVPTAEEAKAPRPAPRAAAPTPFDREKPRPAQQPLSTSAEKDLMAALEKARSLS